jgi:peptide chain release factor 1
MNEPKTREVSLDERDLEEHFTRGSGKGGQHRNVTDSAVRLKHKPTGLQVKLDGGRSQAANRQTAREVLTAKLLAAQGSDGRNDNRKLQVGSGMRGDKVRTVATQRDQVTDHRTGRTTTAKRYLRGNIKDLALGG